MGRVWQPLARPTFRRLWMGQAVSAVGDQLSVVAVAALVIGAGHGAGGLGIVLAARSLGLVVFIPAGGIIGDRARRTRVMIVADVVRVAVTVALALLYVDAPVLAYAGLALLLGAGEAVFEPAYRALLPTLLPESELESGNALTALTAQAAFVIGPAFGGVLIATGGTRIALWADAATFAASLATLLLIAEPLREVAIERPSILDDLREGLRAVLDRPWLALVVAMSTLHLVFAVAPWLVLLPVIANEDLGGTEVYGWLLAVAGVGAMAGALLAGRWRPRLPGLVAMLALLPSALTLLVLIGPAPLAVVGASVLLGGAGEAVFDIYWNSGLQRDVPDRLLARVFSLDFFGSLALMPLGYALTGPAVDALGRDTVLVFGAVVVVTTLLPLLAIPSVRRFSSRSSIT
jgi:MFS family permease